MNAEAIDIGSPGTREQRVSVPLNCARLSGRLEREEKASTGTFVCEITIPAADTMSHPARVVILSRESLGKAGDHVEADISIGGYVQESTNRETGAVYRNFRPSLRTVGD